MVIQNKRYSIGLVLFMTLPLLMEFKAISGSAARPALVIAFIQVVIFALCIRKIMSSIRNFLNVKTIVYLLLLVLLSTIIVFSSNYAVSIAASLKSSILFLLPSFMLVFLTISDDNILHTTRLVLKVLVIYGLFISLYGLIIYLIGQYDHNTQFIQIGNVRFSQIVMGVHRSRISSVTSNPNVLGTLLMFSIPANLYFIEKIKNSKFMIIVFLIQSMALLLTESRASIISIVLICFIYVFLISEKKLKFIIYGLIVTLFFISILFLSEYFPIERLSDGLNGRDEQWLPLIDSIKQRPFSGSGFGLANRVIIQRETHNVYLSVLAEMGIIGLFSFLGLWIFGTYNLFKRLYSIEVDYAKYKTLVFLFSISIGLFVHQFFETDLMQFDFTTLFWVFILSIGCKRANVAYCNNLEDIDVKYLKPIRSKV